MGSHYCHLKLEERRKLAKWLEAKMPISEIADCLGRAPSTIYRDIERNRYTDTELVELNGYYASRFSAPTVLRPKAVLSAPTARCRIGW